MDNEKITIQEAKEALITVVGKANYDRALMFKILNIAETVFKALISMVFISAFALMTFVSYSTHKRILPYIILALVLFFICKIILYVTMRALCKDIEGYFSDFKLSLANNTFRRVDRYDSMEDWVKDKVFKDEILPLILD